MPALYIGRPRSFADKDVLDWARNALVEIERADRERADVASIAQDFTVTNYTTTRTLNAGTATATDVANVLCTFIDDIKRRGKEGKD